MFISRDSPLTLAWANHLSDQSIYRGLRYLSFQSVEIVLDERLRGLTLCYIDFADPKGTFNYQKCREVLSIGAKPVDVVESVPEPKPEPTPEPVETVENSASASAPAPKQFSTPKPRQSSMQS